MKHAFRRIFILALCLCIVLLPLAARTDFGSYSGDSDYGSSSSSSSSSNSSNSSGGGGGGGEWSGETVLFFLAVLVIGFGWRILKNKLIEKGILKSKRPTEGRGAMRPASLYTKLDPAFDAEAVKKKVADLYVGMQQCWQAKDISPLRPYFSDALFAQMDLQLGALRKQGQTNYVEQIKVEYIRLLGYYQQAGQDHLVVKLTAHIIDYTLEDETQQLISGSREKKKEMTYEWDLSRPGGRLTGEQAEAVSCPSCGAPLDVNAAAECPYCGTVITRAAHDWVISSIQGISQRTL